MKYENILEQQLKLTQKVSEIINRGNWDTSSLETYMTWYHWYLLMFKALIEYKNSDF